MNVLPGEVIEFRQRVWFDGYLFGTTGGYSQSPPGQYTVMRASDGTYWNGSAFSGTTPTYNSTLANLTQFFHYFQFTFPTTDPEGYVIRMRLLADASTEAVFNVYVTSASGGGGGSSDPVFDAVDFATGLPFR